MAFGHKRRLQYLSDNRLPVAYGTRGPDLRGSNRGIFSLGGKLASRFRTGAAFIHSRASGHSASSPDGRPTRRLGLGADQCVDVKIPTFFHCTAKPRRADVTSVVHARQHHPRTARFQPNDITGLERLCHDLSLQISRFVPHAPSAQPTPSGVMKLCRQLLERNAFRNGCSREMLRYGRTHAPAFHRTCGRQRCGCRGACRSNGAQ